MHLYFVRHGKTKWNLEGKYQGGSGNSPLLPESYADVKKLSIFLDGTKFRMFYVSPLQRAMTTAVVLRNDMGIVVPITVDPRLKEFDLGKLEGMKFVEAESKYASQIKAFRFAPDKYDPSAFNGENFDHMLARGKDLVNDIVKRFPNDDDNVLLVSHGAALSALTMSLLGYKLADLRKRGGLVNTSLSVLETTDKGKTYTEVLWNETSFLDRKLTSRDMV